jgi:glutathione peroxidase
MFMKTGAALLAATIVSAALSGTVTPATAAAPAAQSCPAFLDQDFRKLHSSDKVNLCKVSAGKPMLIINTASNCGFTPQYKSLEALHQKYKARGLTVVGFASNDFNQESKDEAKSAEICFLNNGVTFTVLSDTHVKGADANPVFKELIKQSSEPKWNFNKYLVTADGKVAKYFPSAVTPDSAEFTAEIEKLLK